MARFSFKDINHYIFTFPQETQLILERVRKTIKEVAPRAEEVISYQIPCFKLKGRYLIYFAGFKDHISIYPAPRGEEEFKEELSKYKGGKGTVQFPLEKEIPFDLIKRIVKFKLKQNESHKAN